MLSLNELPLKNLKGYGGRTAALFFFAMLMGIAIFGGSMVVSGIRAGLAKAQARLGADIIVTPADAENGFNAQTVLLQAEPGYFYMDKGKLDEISAVDGIEALTPQRFMASAKAGCCSARLQMIAFDPESDFVIRPWLKEADLIEKLDFMDIVIGSNVTVYNDNIIRFYDKECRIVGQFEPTGTTLDNCVYMNFDTVNELIRASFEKRLNLYEKYMPEDVISAVMVKVRPGADIESVSESIRAKVNGVSVATSKNMVAGIGETLGRVSHSVFLVAAGLWGIGTIMTVLIFSLMIHERRREFASLSAMGASLRILSGIVTREALLVNLAGNAVGIFVSGIVLFMFSSLIGQSLGVGFIIPSVITIMKVAALVLASAAIVSVVSSHIAVRNNIKKDAGLVLKEGE